MNITKLQTDKLFKLSDKVLDPKKQRTRDHKLPNLMSYILASKKYCKPRKAGSVQNYETCKPKAL